MRRRCRLRTILCFRPPVKFIIPFTSLDLAYFASDGLDAVFIIANLSDDVVSEVLVKPVNQIWQLLSVSVSFFDRRKGWARQLPLSRGWGKPTPILIGGSDGVGLSPLLLPQQLEGTLLKGFGT